MQFLFLDLSYGIIFLLLRPAIHYLNSKIKLKMERLIAVFNMEEYIIYVLFYFAIYLEFISENYFMYQR